MRITTFSASHAQMGQTRTVEDFAKWIGAKPARLGIVSNLYKQFTASALTEALMNTYYLEKNKQGKFSPVNSFMVEWEIQVNFVKRIPILAVDGGGNASQEIIFQFPEHYYEKNDVFVVEETRQQFFVLAAPYRRSDACWEYVCRLVAADYVEVSDVASGQTTRFLTNHQPELHEDGYTKYQSNIERHRTFIGTTRNDVDFSAQYAAMEDQFIQIADGAGKEHTYKLLGAEKACLDSFMLSRNNKLLFAKGNVDANGKTTLHDDVGRPIIAAEGIIPQIERFASKFIYTKLSTSIFEKALNEIISKCDTAEGNTITFVCNTILWNQAQRVLGTWMRDNKADGAYLWSTGEKKYVNVGATYGAYTWAGNTIIFKQDRSLNLEFPNKGYGFFLDLTTDNNGTPGLMMFSFKGGDLIRNVVRGVGGTTGLESGDVSSPVAGSKIIHWGYHGVGVIAPYRSAIIEEL